MNQIISNNTNKGVEVISQLLMQAKQFYMYIFPKYCVVYGIKKSRKSIHHSLFFQTSCSGSHIFNDVLENDKGNEMQQAEKELVLTALALEKQVKI